MRNHSGKVFAAAAVLVALATAAYCVPARTAPPAINPFDQLTAQQLSQQAKILLAQAQKSASGVASTTLETYAGHTMMLTVRTRGSGAELHRRFNDVFIVMDGEATQRIGGTMSDSKEVSPGELRGANLSGAEEHVMRKGDVIHIAAGVPHQTVVASGMSFTYFVIKIEEAK